MKQKRLMLLGGSRYLLPAIETAHKLGAYVITCDFLPNNYAHKFSDEYCNISLLDTPALLAKAKELKIDGVLGFANDIGVLPAAVIATEMGLPTPPLKSVEILQNKDKFRDFLEKNGFNCPWHHSFSSVKEAMDFFHSTTTTSNYNYFPCIVKPVDSCGSKGCTRVDNWDELPAALDEAFAKCYNGKIIVEQFLELEGRQSGSDCFSVDNELVYCTFGSQYFDGEAANPYAPVANTWPSIMPQKAQDELRREIQRLITLLDMRTTLYNIETRVARDGKAYIMEVSPRAGGNCMAEVISLATGQDIILANVMFALGMNRELSALHLHAPEYDGVWAYYVLRSSRDGVFKDVKIDSGFKYRHVKLFDMYVKEGDTVHCFTGANRALGVLFLRFDEREQLESFLANQSEFVKVIVA